jgi:hypothetical protein
LSQDYILWVTGTVKPGVDGNRARVEYNQVKLIADINVKSLVRALNVYMHPKELFDGKQQTISTILEQFPGNVPLWFHFQDNEEDMGVSLVSNFRVDFNEEVQIILEEMSVRFQFQLDDRI